MDTGLAYDVGGYDGADTANYLAQGFRVVCIEADPSLAEMISKRFAGDDRVKVLNVAIGEKDGHAPFYISENLMWNSFDKASATRQGYSATEIMVPTRSFDGILKEHGVPYFLKVDIEGADHECLKPLNGDLPQYLSFEAAKDSTEMLLQLIAKGYTRFSLMNQHTYQTLTIPAPGSPAYVSWAAKQWIRLELRKHPGLHKLTKGLRAPKSGHTAGTNSAGPTPMSHTDGWYSAGDFMRVWMNVLHSGILESAWFDVHAALR